MHRPAAASRALRCGLLTLVPAQRVRHHSFPFSSWDAGKQRVSSLFSRPSPFATSRPTLTQARSLRSACPQVLAGRRLALSRVHDGLCIPLQCDGMYAALHCRRMLDVLSGFASLEWALPDRLTSPRQWTHFRLHADHITPSFRWVLPLAVRGRVRLAQLIARSALDPCLCANGEFSRGVRKQHRCCHTASVNDGGSERAVLDAGRSLGSTQESSRSHRRGRAVHFCGGCVVAAFHRWLQCHRSADTLRARAVAEAGRGQHDLLVMAGESRAARWRAGGSAGSRSGSQHLVG